MAASGIATFDAEEAADVPSVPAGQGAAANGDSSTTTWVNVGPGLPALPKKLVQRIKANECVDFAEFPPAKGKSRPLPQAFEGQAIVVQAADLVNTRKPIQDLAVWSQCFVCPLCGSPGSRPARKIGRPDGLPIIDCKSQPQVQVAFMGGLRPQFPAGGSGEPQPGMGEGGPEPLHSMLHEPGSQWRKLV